MVTTRGKRRKTEAADIVKDEEEEMEKQSMGEGEEKHRPRQLQFSAPVLPKTAGVSSGGIRRASRVPFLRDSLNAALRSVTKHGDIHGAAAVVDGANIGIEKTQCVIPENDGPELDRVAGSSEEIHDSPAPVFTTPDKKIRCVEKSSLGIRERGGSSEFISAHVKPLCEGTHDMAAGDAVNTSAPPWEGFADSGSHGSRFALAAPTLVENNPSMNQVPRVDNESGQNDEHAKQATSVNLTEVAGLLDEECSNYDRADFLPSNPLVTVYGYRVKPDIAPILGAVISKYGDIVARCSMRSNIVRSSLLQSMCELVQKLEASELVDLMPAELDAMREAVSDLESNNVGAGWLGKRLDEIQEVKVLLKRSKQLKEAKRNHGRLVEKKKKELLSYVTELQNLQLLIQSRKVEVEALEGENSSFDKELRHTKALVKKFYRRSLIDDLL